MNVLVNSIEVFNSLPSITQHGLIEYCQRRFPLFAFSYQIFSDSGVIISVGLFNRLYQFDEMQKYLTQQQMSEIRLLITQHNTIENGGVILNPSNVLIVNVERLEANIRDLFTMVNLSINVEINRETEVL